MPAPTLDESITAVFAGGTTKTYPPQGAELLLKDLAPLLVTLAQRLEAAEATILDHEARIAALEAP